MTLTLCRLPISLSGLARWAGDRGWTRRQGGDFDEGRALHHLLAETFGKGALQPFRLMVPPRGGRGHVYAWTDQTPEALRDLAAAIALPEIAGIADPAALQARVLPPFHHGQRLGMDVLARPVRRLRHPAGGFAAGAEMDVWLVERLRAHPEGAPDAPPHDRAPAYLDWLAERLAGAATLDRAASRVAGMRRRRVARGGTAVEGPEVTFHATITVDDLDAFAALLRRGVGRHAAYGYGMALLRAPNAPPPEG